MSEIKTKITHSSDIRIGGKVYKLNELAPGEKTEIMNRLVRQSLQIPGFVVTAEKTG